MGRLFHPAHGLIPLIALLAIVLLCSGCGGSASAVSPGGDQTNNQAPPAYLSADVFADLPGIPWDDEDPAHATSEDPGTQITVMGADYLQMHNGEVDGTSLILTGRPPDQEGDGPAVAYGLYRISGLSGKKPLALNTQCLPAFLGNHYFIGIADYTDGEWLEFGPISTPEYEIDLSGEDHRFVSQLGNLYFVVAVPPSHSATHSQSTLFVSGGGEDPALPGKPRELMATDGTYTDKVVIEWMAGDGANYYEVYRQPTDEIHGTSATDGDWTKIGETEHTRYEDSDVDPGRVYNYKARSANDTGFSGFSNIDSGYSSAEGGSGGDPPGPPIELVASDGTYDNGVQVEWSGGEGAGWFRIARQDVDPETEWAVIGESESHHYFDENVEPGKHYRYKAQAVNEHGHSEWSNTDTGYAAEGGGGDPPGHVFELVASDGTYDTGVQVEWSGGEGAGWFIVQRIQADSDGEWTTLGDPTERHFFDETAEPGVVYKYRAKAVNEYGESDWSNTDTGYRAEGGGGDPPGHPFELWASDGTYDNGVQVEWSGGEGAGWFIVQRRVAETETEWQTIGDPTDHHYFDETAEPGVVYEYRVKAANEYGESEWSNTDTGYRAEGGSPPGHPYELWATDGTYENAVQVNWSGGEGAGWFRVQRQDVEPLTEWTVIGESESHQYMDEDVIPGKHYRYRVQAVNEFGHSEWSNTDTGYAAGGGDESYSISGTVMEGEHGLSCAVTLLVVGDDEVTVETGEGGAFTFDGLSPGLYIVYPYSPHYVFTHPYMIFTLSAEHPTAEGNFSATLADDTHQAFGFIYSLVQGEGGLELVPLAGTMVVAWQEGTEFETHVMTNEDGYFHFEDLPDGVVLFKPTKDGYVFTPTIHDATISGDGIPPALNFRGNMAP